MFYLIFLSAQVKLCAIITHKHGINELAYKLLNNLRFKTLPKIEILLKCFNLMDWSPSTQSPCQNENFANSSKKVQKISHETFPEVHCFKWKLESVSNIL